MCSSSSTCVLIYAVPSYYYTCVRVKDGGETSDDFGTAERGGERHASTFGSALMTPHNTITNTVVHRSAASKVVRR